MASRVAVLRNPANSAHAGDGKDVRAAGQVLGLALQPIEVGGSDECERAFEQATRGHADALLLLLDPLFTANSRRVAQLATKKRLPTIYGLRQLVEEGGLMAYGLSAADLIRHAVSYVDISKHAGRVKSERVLV
jgi:putative ABC transport system substrate-binding protein